MQIFRESISPEMTSDASVLMMKGVRDLLFEQLPGIRHVYSNKHFAFRISSPSCKINVAVTGKICIALNHCTIAANANYAVLH